MLAPRLFANFCQPYLLQQNVKVILFGQKLATILSVSWQAKLCLKDSL
jgi:hypothetical protein